MYISRLRLAGFKSFADPTEVRIETGLTGIVGPNGCGKSNIVDAIRWVMGESSARGLRGGEMEDVIFAGSDARPTFDFAEVAMVLEPPSGVGASPIEVVRRLGRGVGSNFRLNGREARARDIARLLADAAAGARSAAIVGQGQIGALVEARPQERQRLLADAAGIGGLQSRRREAELRLDAATVNLRSLAERQDLLTGHEAKLIKEAKEAARYRKVNQRHREVQVLLLLARVVEAERRSEAARNEAEAAGEATRRATLQAERAVVDARTAGARLPELRAAEQHFAAERARLDERLAARRADAEAAALALERWRTRSDELARDLAREEAALDEAAAAVAELETERREGPARLAELQRLAEAADQEATAAGDTARAAEKAWETAVAGASRAREEASAAAKRRQGLATEIAAVERDAAALGSALAEARGRGGVEAAGPGACEVAEARARLAAAEARLVEVEAVVETAAEDLRAAEIGLQRAREAALEVRGKVERHAERRADLDARDRAARADLERVSTRLAGLEGERATAERGLADLDPSVAERAREAAATREAKVLARDARRGEMEAAATRLDAARREVAEAELAVARLEAEAGALADAEVPAGEPVDPALPLAAVPQDLHASVVAALGDDALAPVDSAHPVHWQELAAVPALVLPSPAEPLGGLFPPPPALAARFAQTGVVTDAATAGALQADLLPGQRLTTRAGGLWRWDGFVRLPGDVSPAGEGSLIARRLRLVALREQLADARARSAEVLAAEEGAAEIARMAATAVADAEAEATAAEEAERITAAALERTLRERGRLDDVLRQLGERLAEADAERGTAEQRLADLAAELASLGDAANLDTLAGKAAADHTAAETRCREAGGAEKAARRDLAETRSLVEQARRDQREVEAAAAAAASARARAAETRAAEIATLEERSRELAERAARLREELATAGPVADRSALAATAAAREAAAADETRSRCAGRREERAVAALAAGNARDRQSAALGEVEATLTGWRQRLQTSREALRTIGERRASLATDQAELGDPTALERAVADLVAEAETVERQAAAAATERAEAEALASASEEALRGAEVEAAAAAERLRAAEARLETARAAFEAAHAAARDRLTTSAAELLVDEEVRAQAQAADADALEHELVRLEAARERLGAVNLRADGELEQLNAELEVLGRERADLDRAIEELRRAIGDLNREGRARILEAFKNVEAHFGTMFTRLFGGGRAELALAEDPNDPLGAGLELSASPPGKRLQALSLLSGGEKALTATALIFAFFRTQPAPLCVLDEVDAPLDDANVARLGDLMGEIADATGTRFLVVTHHPLTMARMHRLYGVTMIERGLSTLVAVELDRAVALRDAG